MKKISFHLVVLITCGLGLCGAKAAELPPYPAQPYAGVQYEYRTATDPAEQIHIVRVDLSNTNVDDRDTAGGEDPDGEGPYQTTLQVPSVIAAREHFEVTVNGDFFAARQTVDAEGEKSGYVTGKWATVKGPCVTDGALWAPASTERAALWLDGQKTPHIAMMKDIQPEATQVIAGSHIIVSAGKTVAETQSSFSRTRHPRTAVGIGADGHSPGQSVGMSLTELGDLLRQLGCQEALNLDGGGSSEMVAREPNTGTLRVLNNPSDKRERAVANVLGISIRGARRTR
jgi:hypothetical protein